MKQLVVLSGKGGTGKTTVASSLVQLSGAKYFADCDVDAPNMHLLYSGEMVSNIDFYGQKKAEIDSDMCMYCGMCAENCKFDAIEEGDFGLEVNKLKCEGCGVCENVCMAGAISLVDYKAGDLMMYKVDDKNFSTAKLCMGSGTSGKLVTEVKRQLKSENKNDLAIIDGSPGIGCPVIASISGAKLVLIVAEPSVAGISDLTRIIKTAYGFGSKVAVCVNKYDINEQKTTEIEDFCNENSIDFVGKIPYDKQAVELINNGKCVISESCPSGNAIRQIYEKVMLLME